MLSISSVVYASSYNTTVNFRKDYNGAVREFNGQNIRYLATMSSDKSNDTGRYTVRLDRSAGLWSYEIGRKSLLRVGKGQAEWTNVGPGKYRIGFEKADDDIWLSSKDVVISNF